MTGMVQHPTKDDRERLRRYAGRNLELQLLDLAQLVPQAQSDLDGRARVNMNRLDLAWAPGPNRSDLGLHQTVGGRLGQAVVFEND